MNTACLTRPIAGLAALAIVALTGCGTTTGQPGPQVSGSVSPGVSASGAPATATTQPQQQTLADGSILAVLRAPGEGTTGSFVLVSPTGEQTKLKGTVDPKWSLQDVARDGHRALLTDGAEIGVVDLTTGQTTKFSPSEPVGLIRFTRPLGQNILATLPNSDKAVRYDLSGSVLATYSSDAWSLLQTKDGTGLFTSTGTQVVLVDNASGEPRAKFSSPTGKHCAARRWWDDNQIVVDCAIAGQNGGASDGHRLYLLNPASKDWKALSAGTSEAAPWGFYSAWKAPEGTLAQVIVGCGAAWLGYLDATGTSAKPIVTGYAGLSSIGVVGDRALYLAGGECGSESQVTLKAFNLSTGQWSELAAGEKNTGTTVDSAVVVDSAA